MTPREKIFPLLILMAMISLIGLTTAVTGDQPAETAAIPIDEAPAGEKPTQEPAGHRPLMIRWSNWQPEFGPAIVYARENDLDGMLAMDAPVQKMLMVTSYGETRRLMERAAELQAAGVTIVGLNTEGGPGMTPPDELQSINDPNPETNLIARVARLATANGFQVIWGPIRNVADSTSDAVIRTILSAGVTGLALQEQKFIERQPARQRATAVSQTRQRYLALAAEAGLAHFGIHVQIMHQRCPDLNNCIEFVRLLEAMPVDSIAIWSNGPIPLSFVQAIRGE